MALERTLEKIAAEVWGPTQSTEGRCLPPNADEYVAVVLDRLEAHGGLTEDEYRRFCLLSRDIRQRLAQAVPEWWKGR
jgi:hypothetical protein